MLQTVGMTGVKTTSQATPQMPLTFPPPQGSPGRVLPPQARHEGQPPVVLHLQVCAGLHVRMAEAQVVQLHSVIQLPLQHLQHKLETHTHDANRIWC